MADLGLDASPTPVEIVDDVTGFELGILADRSLRASLGNTGGKTTVLKTGNLVTTAVTVDQVVLTYTVTAGKTFFLEYLDMSGAQTAPAGGTSVALGTISTETPSGTKVISKRFIGGGATPIADWSASFAEPLPIVAGTVIRVVVTPASATSMTWFANFGGYER